MSNPQTFAQESDRRPHSTITVNLRTVLLLLACALPAVYAAGRFERSGADPNGAAGDRGLHRVDLNSAGVYELFLLEGVGETTARKIIASRGASGPFAAVDDLQRVKGIGPKTVATLRPYVLTGTARPGPAESHTP